MAILNEWLIILGFGALGALAHLGVVRSFMNARRVDARSTQLHETHLGSGARVDTV